MIVQVIIYDDKMGPDQITFDIVLPGGSIHTETLTPIDVRHYRSASIKDIIEHHVYLLLQDHNYTSDNYQIEYKRVGR